MKHFALIGTPLAHSQSPAFFAEQVAPSVADYTLLELNGIDCLRSEVERCRLDGFNVTIPYKRAILPLLDSIDPIAEAIGAVNVVRVKHSPEGRILLHGTNTDAPAFLQTLRPLLRPYHRRALILGTGGAAQAVSWALRQIEIGHSFVSRTPQESVSISYDEAVRCATENSPLLIINATPVGMGDLEGCSPWPRPDLISTGHLIYDLIYNPYNTQFLVDAARQGATVKNGLEMLHLQALLSYRFWGLPC